MNKNNKIEVDANYLNELIDFASRETLQYKLNNEVGRDSQGKYYGYIPMYSWVLQEIAKDIKMNIPNLEEKQLIDAGAGTNLVANFFKGVLDLNSSVGLEISDVYLTLDKSKKLIKGDILKFNFKDYDIIYSYNPIRDNKLMIKGLKNIIKTMKNGAVLYYLDSNINPTQLKKLGLDIVGELEGRIYKFIKKS